MRTEFERASGITETAARVMLGAVFFGLMVSEGATVAQAGATLLGVVAFITVLAWVLEGKE